MSDDRHSAADREQLFAELRRELFDLPAGGHIESATAPLTPGERLLYALGQMQLLSRRRRLPGGPAWFTVEDVARLLGLAGDIELVQSDERGTSYHLPGEVLVEDAGRPRRWRLLSAAEWAAERELPAPSEDLP